MNKLINYIKKEPFIMWVGIISIILLIIGTLVVGFTRTFILLLFLDIIVILIGKPNKNKKEKFKAILLVIFTLGIFALLASIAFFAYIVVKAPEFNTDNLYNKEASVIYYNNNEVMAKLGDKIRKNLIYDEIPEVLVDAIIATEDSRFFQHNGVDLPRFLKASFNQVLGRGGGGASTLTMQVAKNSFTSTEASGIEGIIRKFTDIYLSVFKIEKQYTKEEIIELYVNSNYLGSGNWGVEQASRSYFGKSAKNMNLAEAAMIAGLFQAPVGYDPNINPDSCEARRKQVLSLMLRHNYITKEEYDIAINLTVDKLLYKNEKAQEYRDFIDTVVMEVIKRTGKDPYSVPMAIYSTMNKEQQDNINSIMKGENFKWENDKIQGATVVIDVKTGAITAIGAGRNIKGEKVQNNATMMKRQIGSTAKPLYDYAPGIEYLGWSTYTPFIDLPYEYSDEIKLRNWDYKYFGWMTLHNALKESRNITALKAFQQLNKEDVRKFVTNLGLSPEKYLHEAHSIGGYTGESPLTVAAAYAAFSNGGYYIEPHSFTYLTYLETGETYTVNPVTRKAMEPSTAYMITKVLEDTSKSAVGMNINGVNYCAKTGTTDYDLDYIKKNNLPKNAISNRWIASFNDSYAIALWYGYEYNSKDYYMTMLTTGQKYLFQAIAKKVYTKKSTWEKPDNVVEVEVETELPEAKLASEFTPKANKVKSLFIDGKQPIEVSTRFSKLDNVTNLNYDDNTNTLSWDAIKTPDFIDESYLDNLFTKMYGEQKANPLKERLNYNKNKIGTIQYNVYIKTNDDLKFITSTSSNSIKYNIDETTTFVVKTSYTIFKDNISDGANLTIQKEKVESIITSELNGDDVITLSINSPYIETQKPIVVYENLIDVTSNATIIKTITRASDNEVVDNITTNNIETFKITYQIKYKNYTNTITRIVEIK